MNFIYKVGDLITSDEPVIAHGCNTKALMGAGIAKQIADTYPDVVGNYKAACRTGDFRVGSVQPIWTRYNSPEGRSRCVVNLGTQREPGPDATLWAVFLAFANLAEWCYHTHTNQVAIPRIGAGIGGLVWSDVETAITTAVEASSSPDLTIVVYDLPGSKW